MTTTQQKKIYAVFLFLGMLALLGSFCFIAVNKAKADTMVEHGVESSKTSAGLMPCCSDDSHVLNSDVPIIKNNLLKLSAIQNSSISECTISDSNNIVFNLDDISSAPPGPDLLSSVIKKE